MFALTVLRGVLVCHFSLFRIARDIGITAGYERDHRTSHFGWSMLARCLITARRYQISDYAELISRYRPSGCFASFRVQNALPAVLEVVILAGLSSGCPTVLQPVEPGHADKG